MLGVRATVGAVAFLGLSGAAAPAASADRVIAVEASASTAGLHVEILVQIGARESARQAADRALEAQGAKRAPEPPRSAAYAYTGLFWDALPVVQYLNRAREPTGAAQSALTNTHSDWSGVSRSRYEIGFGGTTSRCPSLVRECPGRAGLRRQERRRLSAPERQDASPLGRLRSRPTRPPFAPRPP